MFNTAISKIGSASIFPIKSAKKGALKFIAKPLIRSKDHQRTEQIWTEMQA
jgi:hypothetical protein